MTTEGGVENGNRAGLISIVNGNQGECLWMEHVIETAGFDTTTETEWPRALNRLGTTNPDLLLIGDNLFFGGAHKFVRALREFSQILPIIVVGSDRNQNHIAKMLQAGTDDYQVIGKHLTDKILVARVRALLRRVAMAGQNPQPTVITNAELTVDLLQHEVRIEDEGVHLTPTEFQIVSFLSMHLGQTVPHAKMISKIWGENEDQEPTFVRMQVCRLRSKLEKDSHAPNYIVTVWGIGYRMPNLNHPQNGSTF